MEHFERRNCTTGRTSHSQALWHDERKGRGEGEGRGEGRGEKEERREGKGRGGGEGEGEGVDREKLYTPIHSNAFSLYKSKHE